MSVSCVILLIGFVLSGMDKNKTPIDISACYVLSMKFFLQEMRFFGFQTYIIRWFETQTENSLFLYNIFLLDWSIKLRDLGSIRGTLFFPKYANDFL